MMALFVVRMSAMVIAVGVSALLVMMMAVVNMIAAMCPRDLLRTQSRAGGPR